MRKLMDYLTILALRRLKCDLECKMQKQMAEGGFNRETSQKLDCLEILMRPF